MSQTTTAELLQFVLGHEEELHQPILVDLQKLIATRLLVAAASGGGKSWVIRRILEQTYGKVQQIVIDIEGDFYTLREKFAYVLIGSSTDEKVDIPIGVSNAEQVAGWIWENKISAIVDLSEIGDPEVQVEIVRLFMHRINNMSKTQRHHALVVLDEAHRFADDNEEIASTKEVVIMATQGRKRGICLIAGTQRLAEFNKTAAAQLLNKLVGLNTLDIDVRRAMTELGFSNSRRREIMELDQGEFFVYGAAISKQVKKVMVGEVETKHPKPGEVIEPPKPVTDQQIKKALGKLSLEPSSETSKDLWTVDDWRKAFEKEKTEHDKTVKELEKVKHEHTRQTLQFNEYREHHSKQTLQTRIVEDRETRAKELAAARNEGFDEAKEWAKALVAEMEKQYDSTIAQMSSDLHAIKTAASNTYPIPTVSLSSVLEERLSRPPRGGSVKITELGEGIVKGTTQEGVSFIGIDPAGMKPASASTTTSAPEEFKAGDPEKAVLRYLLWHGREASKVQVAVFSGYSVTSSHFKNTISRLVVNGLIEKTEDGNSFRIAPGKTAFATQLVPGWTEFSQAGMLDRWESDLGSAGKILRVVRREHLHEFTKEELAQATEYSVTSSHFKNMISELAVKGFIVRKNGGKKLQMNLELVT